MEFEEMQVIWNAQNEERLYAIDETALAAQITRRSRWLDRKLTLIDWIMIGVNLGVGIVLLIDGLQGDDPVVQYLMPAAYLAFFVIAIARRLLRRQDEKQFEDTMLGELDRAIWRVDYLITQGRSLVLWYLLPLLLLFGIVAYRNEKLLWAVALFVILLPITYVAGRWEVNRFYLPKKRSLEALRDTLTSP